MSASVISQVTAQEVSNNYICIEYYFLQLQYPPSIHLYKYPILQAAKIEHSLFKNQFHHFFEKIQFDEIPVIIHIFAQE